MYKVVPLNDEHLAELGVTEQELLKAYFSPNSLAYCLLYSGVPVLAGGVVSLGWSRGEAWLIHTPFFLAHVKACYRYIRDVIPLLSIEGGFKRIQATCLINTSTSLVKHLKFEYEGALRHYGRGGETCYMYARLF